MNKITKLIFQILNLIIFSASFLINPVFADITIEQQSNLSTVTVDNENDTENNSAQNNDFQQQAEKVQTQKDLNIGKPLINETDKKINNDSAANTSNATSDNQNKDVSKDTVNNATNENLNSYMSIKPAAPLESSENKTLQTPAAIDIQQEPKTNSNPVPLANSKKNLAQYLIEIPVPDYTSPERDKAFNVGLQNLLLKLTGENDIKSLYDKVPGLQNKSKDPSVFVRSYSYVNHSPLAKIAPITTSTIPTSTQPEISSTQVSYIQIQFDPDGISQILPKKFMHQENVPTEALQKLPNSQSLSSLPQTVKTGGNIISMRISNVKDLNEYSLVVKYLLTFPQVTKVDLQSLNPDNVELNVTCVGGVNVLLKSLKAPSQHKLVFALPNKDETNVVDLNYKWVP